MNEGPIQKVADAAQEIAKAAEKLTSFMIAVVGAPLEQVSGSIDDRIRLYRYRNLLKIQDQVEQLHAERRLSGKTVPIPPKFAIPIMDAASFEDDENLQTLWSRLIANATDPQHQDQYHPAFKDVLQQLSSDEAIILTALSRREGFPILFEQRESTRTNRTWASSKQDSTELWNQFEKFCGQLSLKNQENAAGYLDNLLRLRLVEHVARETQKLRSDGLRTISMDMDTVDPAEGLELRIDRVEFISATRLGIQFFDLCVRK